jgi:hypothetical protein
LLKRWRSSKIVTKANPNPNFNSNPNPIIIVFVTEVDELKNSNETYLASVERRFGEETALYRNRSGA